MRVKERGFNWRSTYRRASRTDQRSSPRQSAMHNKQRRHGVTDLDNALLVVPITTLSTVRGQGFQTNSSSTTCSLCSRHCCSYYIRPRPHETGTDRQRSDYVAAPLSLKGLPVGSTERSLSPTYDTHVALGLGTPTHPLAANCRSYLQHQGIPIYPDTKTEHTSHATTPTCALAHPRAHTRTRQGRDVML
jgi:hypothetical protein